MSNTDPDARRHSTDLPWRVEWRRAGTARATPRACRGSTTDPCRPAAPAAAARRTETRASSPPEAERGPVLERETGTLGGGRELQYDCVNYTLVDPDKQLDQLDYCEYPLGHWSLM